MQPHEQRVLDEKKELDEKRIKLAALIGGEMFSSLPLEEQARLHHQSSVMQTYSDILGERITHFFGFKPKIGAVGGFGE